MRERIAGHLSQCNRIGNRHVRSLAAGRSDRVGGVTHESRSISHILRRMTEGPLQMKKPFRKLVVLGKGSAAR